MDKQNSGRGRYILKQLSQHYTLHWIDIGDDARLSKSGFVFDISVYEIEDIGHLCMMNMKAMFGLMRMETVILSVTQKDVPLLNIDWVKVPGKQTLIGELYNTQLEPWPNESQAAFYKFQNEIMTCQIMNRGLNTGMTVFYTPVLTIRQDEELLHA
jgi:hypothetical protein